MIATVTLATGALLWVTRQSLCLRGFQRVHREPQGWWGVELRRQAALMPDIAHRFPLPRETRVRVVHVAGLPLWRQERSVGLPPSAADRIAAVSAHEFDHLFGPDYR